MHRAANAGFCARYGVYRLVYFELHGRMDDAILREKRVKRWRRAWKLALIEGVNPAWEDLYEALRAGELDLAPFAAPPIRGDRRGERGPGPSPDQVRSRPG